MQEAPPPTTQARAQDEAENRRDYQGEQRFNTTGLLGVQVVVITHTETDDEIHFISMREAENHETRQFFSQL